MSVLIEKDSQYIAHTYGRFPVSVLSGKGSEVYDEEGKRYIDLTSGIGVTSFGICDELWVAAVTEQLAKVQHMSNLFYTKPCVDLAEMLCQKTGMKKVFFCNSGAEANECAVKVARKYAAEKKGSDFFTIVTLQNSFHGRTLTTLSATGQDHYHELFQPLTPGFVYTPANDIAALEQTLESVKAAALLIECIQGEGGVQVLEPAFVQKAAELCKEKDILLMVDEVQTGNGRTGKLYAYMNYGIVPDVVTTDKGIGGGLPLGAALLSEKVENVLGKGDHGSTFGGNPIACAGACSIISRLTDEFLSEVENKGKLVFAALTGAKGIEAVTGMGLMVGLKTTKSASEVVNECLKRGVMCLTAKEKVRLLPALNIGTELLEEALQVIKAVCGE